jgi:hypothetical protein
MTIRLFCAITLLCFLGLSCSSNEFSGDSGLGARTTPKKSQNQPPNNDEKKPDDNSGLIIDDSGVINTLPDYKGCLNLTTTGKQSFGTKCGANQAVVIVDDGSNGDMTCCPLSSNKILSIKAEEKHVSRNGRCFADELLTGMGTSSSGISYCSKINTDLFKLSAILASSLTQATIGGDLGRIADTYAERDACICPEGTVSIGEHSSLNNVCTEKCVRIEKK